jgi:hypothetical protein
MNTRKLEALVEARRHREAFDLGQTVVASGKAAAVEWFCYSRAALNMGETTEAIRAAKKAKELEPNQFQLPPWAK